MVFSPLQQRVGSLEVHPSSSDSSHHEIGAPNAVEHRPRVDQRCAIDHQGFRLVQLAVLVQNPCNQTGRQSRCNRVRANILLRNAQPLTVMPLRRSETYLPELCDPLKAAPIYRREDVPPILVERIGYPGCRIELLEVAGLHVAKANNIGGDIRGPRISRSLDAILRQGQRPFAVILQRDGNGPDRLAFAQQVTLGQMGSSDIVLYFGCELQGLIKTQRECQSPGDRQSDLGLTSQEFIGKLSLPVEQGEEITSLYQSHCAILDPADRTIGFSSYNRVLVRFGPQFLGGIPKCRAPVQLGSFNAPVRLQPLSQIFGEQRMITKPDAIIVERREQHLALGKRCQDCATRARTGYGFA